MDKVKDLDLYLLLEVEPEADEKTIKKAYRKKALTCHPDKNPDNKAAIERFHQLSSALEVLTDESTRRAYDNVLKARKAAELRSRQLDGKRRKLKDDLEMREKEAKLEEFFDRKSEEEKLAKEIERLRKEGSRQLEEEQEYVRSQLVKETLQRSTQGAEVTKIPARVKVKWGSSDSNPYNKESLEKIFNKYGTVTGVVVNEKKGGSALVEFEDLSAARMAVNIETGFLETPLKVKGLFEDKVPEAKSESSSAQTQKSFNSFSKDSLVVENDFESLVLRRLRQEEERKRLIQKMMEEDENS